MPRALSEIYLENATIDGVPYPSQGGHPISLTYLNGVLSPLFPLLSGWAPANETWTYASATTITVPSGATSRYQKGDKIKLTQTTVKYFYIVGVADTTLTITGGSDYTLANAAITDNYYSKVENPQGFPDWFNWTPTFGGSGSMTYTAVTTRYARFRISGRTLMLAIYANGTTGGSASNTLTATIPLEPVYATANPAGPVWVLDDTYMVGYCYVGSAALNVRKHDTSNWGIGINKVFSAQVTYEF